MPLVEVEFKGEEGRLSKDQKMVANHVEVEKLRPDLVTKKSVQVNL
jgi:hypothetical protein